MRAPLGPGRGFRGGGSAFRLLAPVSALLVLLAVLLLRTQGIGADATCSVPPVNLTSALSADGSAVVLTWEASPDCTPDEYAVYRRDMDVEGARMTKIDSVDGSVLTYTDDTVTAGQHYRYRIRSNDQGSRSGRTDITIPEATVTEPTPEPEPESEPQSEPQQAERSARQNFDVTAPSLQVVNVDGTSLVLIYDELLDESSTPAAGDYTVDIGGTDYTPSSVVVRGAEVALTLSTGAASGDTVTLDYTKGTNPVKDLANNEAVAETSRPVTNHTGATNDRPEFSSEAITISIDENTPIMTAFGDPVAATDDDTSDTLTYSLPANVLLLFGVGTNTGQLSTFAPLDFESTSSYVVPLYVRDSKGPAGGADSIFDDSIKVTINVNDVNEPPTITGTAFPEVDENTTSVGTYMVSDDDPADTHLWSIASDTSTEENQDGSLFEIGSTSGVLSFKDAPDYETPGSLADTPSNTYQVTIEVTDSGSPALSDTFEVVVNVEDVNEAPDITSTGSSHTTISKPEGTGPSDALATYAADDPEDDTLTWSLGGADAADFTINSSTGELRFQALTDYEDPRDQGTNNVYNVTVRVRDSKNAQGGNDSAVDDSINVAVTVTNIDEAGTVTLPGTITAGQPVTATLTDHDGATSNVTWQWSRSDTALGTFTPISGATSNPYTPVAADVGKYLKATASYTDPEGSGKSATSAASSQVASGNVDPSFSSMMATRNVNENSASGANVGSPVSTTDDDGDTLEYRLTGADAGSFSIDTGDGQIKTSASLNFESNSSYSVVVEVRDKKDASGASDTVWDDTIAVTINVNNLDEPGTVTITGTESGGETLTASVTDIDGTPTSVSWQWALGASASGPFAPISGATSNTYTSVAVDVNRFLRATATYTDPQGSGKSANAVTGQISASNNEPEFDETSPASREVPENSGGGVNVGDPVEATDDDSGDTLTYSFGTGGDESSFTLDTGTGQIKTKSGVDYDFEDKAHYSVTLRVHDNKDAASNSPHTNTDDEISVIITLTDVNEQPAIKTTQTAISVAENQTAVLAYLADDPDNNEEDNDSANTLTWSVESADDGGFFEIGATSGVLTFKDAPNFENKQDAGGDGVYNVTVTVTDNGIDGARGTSNHLSVSKSLAVTVTDVNETPTLTTAPATATFDENATGVVATYIATDPDATTGTMSWDLSGNDAGDFNITSTVNGTAELTFKSPPDYENPDDTGTNNTYDVIVRVRDNGSPRLEDSQGVQVMVNDLNERPVVSGDMAPSFQEINFSRDPSAIPASDYEVATFTAYDDDDDMVSWSVAGDDAAHFSINASTGVLSFDIAPVTHPVTGEMTARPDFERPDDMGGDNEYVIQVRADDQQGESNSVGTFEVTVTVTALNEIPVLISGDLNPTFAEIPYDADSWDSLIGEYRGHDEEGHSIFYETLAGLDTGDIEGSSVTTIGDRFGRLRFKNRPNFEQPADSPEAGQTEGDNVYKVTMRLRDTAGVTSRIRPYPIAVTVTNVDEKPEITPLPNALYDEIEYDAGVALADIDAIATFTARDEEGEVITWELDGPDASDFTITKDADGKGVLRFASLPDFEQSTGSGSTSNIYQLIILARDANTPPDNTLENVGQLGEPGDEFLVQVDDVNEQPEFTGSPSATLSYDENAISDVVSYTARDEEGFVNWSLEGPDRLDFTIDAGGTVTFNATPNWEDPHDANVDNVYQYTVVATDIQSGPTRRAVRHDVTLTVQDVEEAGSISVSNLNPAVGESVTFTISDPDGGIVLNQLPGTGGFAWVIQTRMSGGGWQQLIHANTALLSYTYVADEDETGLELRAIVNPYTDRRGGGKSVESEATAAITPDPIPNAPPRIRTGSAQDIPETGAGEDIGERVTATDRDNDTLTFAIGEGGDGALFEINPSTGQLRTVEPLDFETTTGLLLVPVNVSDGKDDQGTVETERVADDETTVSIRVLDVEEEGVVTLSVPEPGVGVTVQATLTDGDGSISGRSWRWARSRDGRTGWTFIPNTTSSGISSSYTTVLADAGFFLRASVTYTDNRGGGKRAEGITALRVFGENQQPTFPATEDGERTVPENSSAGTNIGAPVAAEDPENDRLTYLLSGTDAASFSIVAGNGQLRVKEPLDFEAKSSYEVTIDVHDGKDGLGNSSATIDDSIDVTITVGNEDEPGTVTLTTLTATIQARVEVRAVLEDDDNPISGSVSWAWHRSPNGRTDWVNLVGETGASYTPTLVDAGNFIRATASYTDGHGQNKTASKVSSRVGDPPPVNSAPSFPATEDGKRDVPEDAQSGDAIGDPVAATDLNAGDSAVNDPLAYSLTGTDADSFTIDEGTGQIRLAQDVSLDFEGKRTYRVTVQVTDGRDQNGDDDSDAIDASRTVTISVTNVNEAPEVSGNTSPSIAENSSAAIATYTGTDPERDTLEWSVNSNDFWISSRGQLYFATPPDYESGTTSFSIRVTAEDPDGLTGSLDVTVTVTDVEEAGVLSISPLRGWEDTRFDAVLVDDDGNVTGEAWQWERSSNRSSWEDIPSATSSSYTAGADDVGNYLRATVEYSDRRGGNKSASAELGARIGDSSPSSNTAPAFDEAEVPRSVGQGTGAGRSVGPPVKATDPDSDDILTYTLSGPDADKFEIDPETGQIRTKAVLDPDVQETHNVTVDVHDGFNPSYDPSDSPDDSVDVIITVARFSSGTFSGGGGGGGGGGGSSGPSPSTVDFEWTVKHDIEPLAGGHDSPTGMWSDGATLWLLENGDGADDAIYAYDVETGDRVEDREFKLDPRNRAPRGVWSDGKTLFWVSDSGQDKLFAYDLATGERRPEADIELTARNRDARGIWSDGTTIWVLNRNPSLFAYDLSSGDLLAEYALDSRNGDPRGLWSDGVSVWVSDHGLKELWAYRLPVLPDTGEVAPEKPPALERVRDEDFTELSSASNNSPRGIWANGDVMYVADESDSRVYTYNMPDAIDARLASLTLSGVDFGAFSPLRSDYASATIPHGNIATLTAVPAQPDAVLQIEPADHDGDPANGHHVRLLPGLEITVTVTAPDGSRMRVYRLRLGEEESDLLILDLQAGGDLVVVPAGAATTAADLFGATDVAIVWQYNRATRAWDRSYLPALGTGDFPIAGGDVLWVVSPVRQTLTVAGQPPPASPIADPITLDLRVGGDLVVVPAGLPTTAADLFGGTDVAIVWQYNRATRAWDRSYLPATDRGGFPIVPGDVLWVVASVAETVGD
ncbi:MAG: cadherin domain-containing protein [Chloroflexi bacterium]|nr:cadherin domain-containing protein [Chloroflexota bacterium]